jgi:hypothetical protein
MSSSVLGLRPGSSVSYVVFALQSYPSSPHESPCYGGLPCLASYEYAPHTLQGQRVISLFCGRRPTFAGTHHFSGSASFSVGASALANVHQCADPPITRQRPRSSVVYKVPAVTLRPILCLIFLRRYSPRPMLLPGRPSNSLERSLSVLLGSRSEQGLHPL